MNEKIQAYKQLVVGSSLNAVLYSFVHSIPLIFKRRSKPAVFETFEEGLIHSAHPSLSALLDLSRSKREIWTKLIFALNASGLLLTNNHLNTIRVDEDKYEVVVITPHARTYKYGFERVYVFDDELIKGLPAPIKRHDRFRVLDWINVRACGPHPLKIITTPDDFVKEIHFISFRRTVRPENIVALSYLIPEQLKNFDFSDTMAKFKVHELMAKNGIKGPRNGRSTDDPTKFKYYAIKIETAYRKVERAAMHYYEDSDALKFMYLTDSDILINCQAPETSYQHKVYQVMNGKG